MGLGKVIDGAIDLTKSWGRALNSNGTVERKIARDITDSKRVSRVMGEFAKGATGAEAAAAEEIMKNAGARTKNAKGAYRETKAMDSSRNKVKAYRDLNRGNINGGAGGATKMQTFGSDVKTAAGLTKEYFTGGSAAQNLTRMGTVGGAYMGVNLAGRGLTGGSLTKNNKGESDIAGIPFL